MRTFVGVIAVLGLAVTVAVAQPPRERGASFRPPEALKPGEAPVARGAADDFPPSSFPTTPVTRSGTGTGSGRPGVAGPAWLSGPGTDPGVVPAAGSLTRGRGDVRQLTPQPKDDPALSSKSFERPKGSSAPQQQQPEPTASTPFRGTSASGSPVFAGPPAYRWYGWGTVTPGANPFAPTGQYPKASANWYSITGATPGAFPVPVMNPLRTPPGTEPPSYGTSRAAAPPQSVVPVATQSQPQPQLQPQLPPAPQFQPRLQPQTPQPNTPGADRPEPPKFNPTGESKFSPGPDASAPPAPVQKPSVPVNIPRITAPPIVPPVAIVPPVVPEPTAVAVKEPAPIPFPPAMKPEPAAELPPVGPRISAPSILPAMEPTKPVATPQPPPGALPISVTEEPKPEEPARVEVKDVKPPEAPKREEYHWQTAPASTQPAPGTWAPASSTPPAPAAAPAPPANDVPAWKSGAANAKPIVARAQMNDNAPDPIATLIRQVCQGRATFVEVRWTGTKKLIVSFEVRTAPEAQKLVTDISRQKELAPYQIDFCAIVK